MQTVTTIFTPANDLPENKPALPRAYRGDEPRLPEQPRAPNRIADAEELRSFIGSNVHSMLRKAKLLCYGNADEAREIVQELYPRMALVLEHSRCGTIEYPWACTHQVMARLAIDRYRKQRRNRARIKRLEFPDSIPDEPPTTLEREDRQRVLAALDALPARDRKILIGIFLEGCKAKDIAAQLGLSESRLAELRQLALGKLREVLA